jgi:hypothetical protein
MVESAGELEVDFQSLIEEAGAILRLTSETCKLHQQERLAAQQRQFDINARDESIEAKRAALELQMGKVQALREKVKGTRARGDEREFTQAIVSHVAMVFGGEIPGGFPLDMVSLKVGSELSAALEETRTVYSGRTGEEIETPTANIRQQIEEEKREKDAETPKEACQDEKASAPEGEAQDAKSAYADIDATYAREKAKYLDMLMDLAMQEREALDAMARDALELGAAVDQEEVEKAAVVSMHYAVFTLKQIATMLAEQKRIWTKVTMDCARLLQVDLRADIEDCMQRSREERIEAYSKPGFKVRILTVAAQWRTLDWLAEEHQSAIQAAYVKMGHTYAKNPTIEEARRLAPVLSAALAQRIAAEIKLLNERHGTGSG